MREITKRRSWPAWLTEDGKFVTGWQNQYERYYKDKDNTVYLDRHFTQNLSIRPTDVGRGRSSVEFYFEDRDGTPYSMSCSAVEELLQSLAGGKVSVYDGYFDLEIMQVKQGTQYSIAPVRVGENL